MEEGVSMFKRITMWGVALSGCLVTAYCVLDWYAKYRHAWEKWRRNARMVYDPL